MSFMGWLQSFAWVIHQQGLRSTSTVRIILWIYTTLDLTCCIHILELHLLNYHRCYLQYCLSHLIAKTTSQRTLDQMLRPTTPPPFSTPRDPNGFNDIPATNELITEMYHYFSEIRKEESSTLLRAITGMCACFALNFKM